MERAGSRYTSSTLGPARGTCQIGERKDPPVAIVTVYSFEAICCNWQKKIRGAALHVKPDGDVENFE